MDFGPNLNSVGVASGRQSLEQIHGEGQGDAVAGFQQKNNNHAVNGGSNAPVSRHGTHSAYRTGFIGALHLADKRGLEG